MEVVDVVVGGLTTLVLGLVAIVWNNIQGFISSDKSWKANHSNRVNRMADELDDRVDNLNNKMTIELAKIENVELRFANELSQASYEIKEKINENKIELIAKLNVFEGLAKDIVLMKGELNKLSEESKNAGYGKVQVIEKRLGNMTEVLAKLVNEMETVKSKKSS